MKALSIQDVSSQDVSGWLPGFEKRLGCSLLASVSVRGEADHEHIDETQLTAQEVVLLKQYKLPVRQQSWYNGRMAVKGVLKQLFPEQIPETAYLNFPDTRLSLTHSGPFALAIGRVGDAAQGIGVDFETHKVAKPETDRFFLQPGERDWIASDADRLRLWTIKEAVFKADLANKTEQRVLRQYRVTHWLQQEADSCWWVGQACLSETQQAFLWASVVLAEGILSVALSAEGAKRW